MGEVIVVVGCGPETVRGLQDVILNQYYELVVLPDLRQPTVPELLRRAALIVLHQRAAPRQLPQVCAHLRRQTNAPLLVMAEGTEETVCAVLYAGADDCMRFSTSPNELIARVRAHLRRGREYSANPTNMVISVGELLLDASRHEVTVRGGLVNLTPREFELLEYLVRRAGRSVTRDELLDAVWGISGGRNATRTLDVHIGRLRQKIEATPSAPQMIVTLPGVGYKLVSP